LDWYFENYLTEPYTPVDIVNKHKDALRQYGESLFKQIFADHKDIYFLYRTAIQQHNFQDIIVEIVSDTPDFQSILWESVKDPNFDTPLAAKGVVFYRKNLNPRLIEARVDAFPWINLLIVTARPDEEDDVNYRTIQRPLLDVIRNAKLKVKPYILRPGTFKSLVDHLNDKGKSFYHIIHFDLHGGLCDYASLKSASNANKIVYQKRYALDDPEPFERKRTFLFFETEKKGVSLPVEAAEMADLLESKQVPVCILNACQSAKQEESAYETSYGRELVKKGIQLVVAMRYSVSVSAVEILMETLYEKLFQEERFETAISHGRQQLYNNKNRRARFGQQVELEDWVLPVVYKNRDVDFNLRAFSKEEEEAFYSRQEKQHVFHPPQYGFHGRDLDILKIEKQVLRHNHLLLQGMGGAGKTTLLDYLAWWWQETGFVNWAFYFPYDQKAWPLGQILHEIAKIIYTGSKFNEFLSKSLTVQKGWLLEALNTERHVLILDNTESITGEKLAIRNTLNPTEREELKAFLSRITGKTFVLMGSRGLELWIKNVTFQDNIYQLKGFDEETAFGFARKILKPVNLDFDEMAKDLDLRRLMKLLAGYPLALKAVLPNLKTSSAKKTLEDLKAGDVNLDKKNIQERTQSVIKCIEYSHSNLSEDAQKLLLCLAPFQSAINFQFIENYFNELKKTETFKDYPFDKIYEVVKEVVQNGFMQEAAPGGKVPIMTLQPVFTYFLKNKLNQLENSSVALDQDTAFINHYNVFAFILYTLLHSQKAKEQQMGVFLTKFEYENLFTTLEKLLNRQESIIYPFSAINHFLALSNNHKDSLKISEMVLKRFESYPSEKLKGNLGMEFIGIVDSIGNSYSKMNQFEKGRTALLKAIELYNNFETKEKYQEEIGILYQNLGVVSSYLKDYESSQSYFKKALEIHIEFEDKHSQAQVYQNLGNVSAELKKFKSSLSYYKKALEIHIEFEDKHSQAQVYQNLGNVSAELKKFKLSLSYYKKALEIFIQFDDKDKQAQVFCNLGIISSDLKDYESSLSYYQKALEIFIEIDDKYKQAVVLFHFGGVSLGLKDYESSKSYFQKALEIFIEFRDKHAIVMVMKGAKFLADESGDEGMLREMGEMLTSHFSKDNVKEFLKSPPDS
jgi:tetratricopeptide (TPR) repeat protein